LSESDKPQPWRVRKADGTEIRVPTRELLESWILAGVVEPDDRVARPGEPDYVLVRELKDVSEAVETGAVVHGPRIMATHPPVFAVVDGPVMAPPPVPNLDGEVLELEPLEGDTIQDAPVIEESAATAGLEIAQTRVSQFDAGLTAPEYPTDLLEEDLLPTEGLALDEILYDLEPVPVSREPAPRTGRVAVAPTTLAPLIIGGSYVSDQAIDPSENPASLIPHIDTDGEIIEELREAPRTGRVAVRATDIDAAHREIELQSTHPERTGIPEDSDLTAQLTNRPDVALQSPDSSPKPSALNRTLNKAPSAPAATDALSRPIRKAGALGGSYSAELEFRALQRERRRTVGITVGLIVVVGAAVALWWSGQQPPVTEASKPATSENASSAAASGGDEDRPPSSVVQETSKSAVAPVAQAPVADDKEPKEELTPKAEADGDKEAAEMAHREAAAAIDEELDSDADAQTARPSREKSPKKGSAKSAKSAKSTKSTKSTKSAGSESSAKGYAALMRAAKKLKRKEPSRALALYKQALAQRPSSPDALSNVGRLQMKSGKTAAAIQTFKKCRKALPRYTPCMYWHGRSLEKAGRRSDAMKAYEKYLDVNPDGSQAIDVRKRLSR
jgi:tetratricopeptide (TPR) repeat protein